MKTSSHIARALLCFAPLTLAASALLGGCAVDPNENLSTDTQALFSYTIPGRQYVGPLSACPVGMQMQGGICYAQCAGNEWTEGAECTWCDAGDNWNQGSCAHRYTLGGGTDVRRYPAHRRPRTSTPICAPGLENIHGSCYVACGGGCHSNGIQGCICDGSGGGDDSGQSGAQSYASSTSTTSSSSSGGGGNGGGGRSGGGIQVGQPGYDCQFQQGHYWNGYACVPLSGLGGGGSGGDEVDPGLQADLDDVHNQQTGGGYRPLGATDILGGANPSTDWQPLGPGCDEPGDPDCIRLYGGGGH